MAPLMKPQKQFHIRIMNFLKRFYFSTQVLCASMLFGLLACHPQEQHLSVENADGNVRLEINAHRESHLDGFKTTMEVHAYDRPKSLLQTELFINELKDDLKVEWDGPHKAVLIFTQRDGVVRRFRLLANEKMTHFYEWIDQP